MLTYTNWKYTNTKNPFRQKQTNRSIMFLVVQIGRIALWVATEFYRCKHSNRWQWMNVWYFGRRTTNRYTQVLLHACNHIYKIWEGKCDPNFQFENIRLIVVFVDTIHRQRHTLNHQRLQCLILFIIIVIISV